MYSFKLNQVSTVTSETVFKFVAQLTELQVRKAPAPFRFTAVFDNHTGETVVGVGVGVAVAMLGLIKNILDNNTITRIGKDKK
ncbi:MAG: hypothetical protein ACD_58C00100G0001 [uncultured bacterium]|nr:MAG: hypothetical protein ACD_58C00100G0001 [uncultured bacterium]